MNKTTYLRGPMRPVINVTTRKDGDKNQINPNIQNNYKITKQLITKSKSYQI